MYAQGTLAERIRAGGAGVLLNLLVSMMSVENILNVCINVNFLVCGNIILLYVKFVIL